MCGIAGIIGSYSDTEKNKIAELMHHRGPDGVNFYNNEKFCFIHSLLKIMDLTDNSYQPMIDDRNGNVIIFNGSIYNYKVLRKKFFSNISFKSNTDTEVILYLYEKFGIDFLNHIKGMFVIAIFDKKKGKLLIARDRYGIKPLFYFNDKLKFIFASEIKMLLTQNVVRNNIKLDTNEVLKFIGHRIISGFDKTLLKNIKVLEPGKFLLYDLRNNKFDIGIYYNNEKCI